MPKIEQLLEWLDDDAAGLPVADPAANAEFMRGYLAASSKMRSKVALMASNDHTLDIADVLIALARDLDILGSPRGCRTLTQIAEEMRK